MIRFTSLLFLVCLTLGACQKSESASTSTLPEGVAPVPESSTHAASPGGAALVPDVQAGTTVVVALEDNRIAIEGFDSIPPGPAVFTVTNAGKQVHDFAVDGPGVNSKLAQPLDAGNVGTLEAVLQPGEYTVYCPILDHRDKGQKVTLVIRPAGAPAPTSTVKLD